MWRRSQLTYCSNVHPGPTLEGLREVVSSHVAAVRRLRRLDNMGTGLWIGARAARQLRSDAASASGFSTLLKRHRISLFTLNGFPYDDFHSRQVKAQVYQPDWADPRRLDYTLDLANILADNLPADELEGTISTLPLGFAPSWDPERQQQAVAALCNLAAALERLYQQSGRRIRICLEMEPGCVLESTAQILTLFTAQLPAAAERLAVPLEQINRHLGICFDICHQAVMFEHPAEAISQLVAADISIGKIQVSSALQLTHPATGNPAQLLAEFAEPRYLHQVRARSSEGTLKGVMDLPEAMAAASPLPLSSPWRVHFHLPIQLSQLSRPELTTTQSAILEVLDQLQKHPTLRPHLEVETYTWQVLPRSLRPETDNALHQGLSRELEWLEQAMTRRGLLQGAPA